MLYNLHTHTFRCNHATGEDKAYVEYAIQSSVKVLGFSDHCPQFLEKAKLLQSFPYAFLFLWKNMHSQLEI